MSNINTGGYAFPIQNAYEMSTEQGMTLRDYFATKAMQVLCKEFNDDTQLAKVAYQIADAMLKAREA